MTAREQAERALRAIGEPTLLTADEWVLLADALAKAAQAVAETHGETSQPPSRQTMDALDAALRALGIGEK